MISLFLVAALAVTEPREPLLSTAMAQLHCIHLESDDVTKLLTCYARKSGDKQTSLAYEAAAHCSALFDLAVERGMHLDSASIEVAGQKYKCSYPASAKGILPSDEAKAPLSGD